MRKEFIKPIICIGVISLIINLFFERSICIFSNVFGIPCPTCGMTRAYISLLHFDFKHAFFYHPLFFLAPFLIFIKKQRTLFIVFILFFACWVIRMWLYFPNTEPMIFNKNAIYVKIFNLIEHIRK